MNFNIWVAQTAEAEKERRANVRKEIKNAFLRYQREEMKTEKRILWLSRHSPTNQQITDLNSIFGRVDIKQVSTTVKDASEVRNLMQRYSADELVAVLPLNLLGEICGMGIHPIRAVMQRKVRKDGEVEFTHDHFERVERVEVFSYPLK